MLFNFDTTFYLFFFNFANVLFYLLFSFIAGQCFYVKHFKVCLVYEKCVINKVALPSSSLFFPSTEDLPEAERLVLSLCCHEDRQLAWKTTYFECLSSGKHFLEQVLVGPPGPPN